MTDAPTVGDDAVLDSIGAILASAMLPDAPAAGQPPAATALVDTPDRASDDHTATLEHVEHVEHLEDDEPDSVEDDEPDSVEDGEHHVSGKRLALEWIAILGVALVVAVVVKVFVISSFTIPSESMHPTLQSGDRVLVNRLAYRAHELRRGDVIVFARPPGSPIDGPDAPKDLIKRVIGLPGDIVSSHDGSVWINGRRLEEPYVTRDLETAGMEQGVRVPEDHVWVMGDNRVNSADSRVFGPLPVDLVVGRAFSRVWPVGRIGFL